MTAAITDCRLLTSDETLDTGTVVFDDSGCITAAGAEIEVPQGAEFTEARGLIVTPGFIDVHVHGGGGYSLATRDPKEIRSYARWVVSWGVTSFLATVFGGSIEEGLAYVRAAAEATGPVEGGATVLGINLEGPFVSRERRGALPAGWIAPADVRAFERLAKAARGQLRLMTFAPELAGAEEVITVAVAGGVHVSLGHSDADYDKASTAFMGGASHVTHAFNAMRFHHREPGIIGAALESPGATIEVIADGVHLHKATIEMLVKTFGPDRLVLVTDGVPPAGVKNGEFRLGNEEARMAGGRVLLSDGTIAGGGATMNEVVRKVVSWNAAGLADAVRMSSTVPARVAGVSERKGRIAPGYDADLVALDDDLEVAMTWVGGRLVYSRA